MALISIILGLMIDRRWDGLSKLRQFAWFSQLNSIILEKTDAYIHNPTVRYISVLAIPVLATMTVQDLSATWSTPVSFLFALFIFIYCLGSLDIEDKFEQIIKSLNDNNTAQAQSIIQEISKTQIDDENMLDLTMQSTMNIMIERLFGVIFWFAVLGPVGAILYRLSQQLMMDYSTDPLLSKSCERMLNLLNWLPERFLTISFAITGHFEGALAAYHENKETDRTQQYLLIDICRGALEGNEYDDKAAYLNAFRGLILRSLIFWLSSIAVLTLLGWN